ncbi:MAG TPA: hypothetical protein VK463_15180 [Desulfomonilaceae bacterium]|nr:hypothetical protein [Desulfomonilaceae bacterium]
MAAEYGVNKKKPYLKTIILGAVTAGLYAVAFANAGSVMEIFTRGGFYAACPIATVFVFSFAHGAFAGNLWSVLGIEANVKQPEKRPEIRPVRPAKRPRPRVRLSV